MAINRFRPNVQLARFNPLSFEELAYAPTILRDREDA